MDGLFCRLVSVWPGGLQKGRSRLHACQGGVNARFWTLPDTEFSDLDIFAGLIHRTLTAGKFLLWGFSGGSAVKNPPANADAETWVQSLGQEDPLEKEMALQYSCLGNPMDRGAWWSP